MFSRKACNLICKSALIAAIITVGPAIQAQDARIAIPGTAAYDALPSAIAPVASAVHASYSAQSQSFSTIHIPEANAIKPIQGISPEALPSRGKWLALSMVSSGAAEFDAYSTRRSIAAGNVEADPTMKPFAGSPAIYAAIQASPVVMDLVAYKMQRSRNGFIRHLWFVPQTTGTAMSLFAGAHNMSIASR
jgi:hypothetical protein